MSQEELFGSNLNQALDAFCSVALYHARKYLE